MANNFKISKSGNSYVLYDTDIIAQPEVELFDRDYHINRQARQNNSTSSVASGETGQGKGIGRAKVVYFELQNKALVLKHYFRGGLPAVISKDSYLWLGLEKTRAFKEWRLLKNMQALNLPVPTAVTAHVRKGLFTYQADLITEEIKDTRTIADILNEERFSDESWFELGVCIKKFHHHDIYHSDLNARNILVSNAGDIYLIDFDNSYLRVSSETWKRANLVRLKRSLLKFKHNQQSFNFDENGWSALLRGYETEL